jgi:hypothetical protein
MKATILYKIKRGIVLIHQSYCQGESLAIEFQSH